MSDTIPPALTGDQFVKVDTEDGPFIIDYVTDVSYLDNGGLEVVAIHEGNRTVEVFPPGRWHHCTTKHLSLEVAEATDKDIRAYLFGKPVVITSERR
jgi:hypothetical protein